MKLSLKGRLQLLIALAASFFFGSVLLTIFQLHYLSGHVSQLASVELEIVDAVFEMEISYLREINEIRGYLRDQNPRRLGRLAAQERSFDKSRAYYRRALRTTQEEDLTKELAAKQSQLRVLSTNLAATVDQRQRELEGLLKNCDGLKSFLESELTAAGGPRRPGEPGLWEQGTKLRTALKEAVGSLEDTLALRTSQVTNQLEALHTSHERLRQSLAQMPPFPKQRALVEQLDQIMADLASSTTAVSDEEQRLQLLESELEALSVSFTGLPDDKVQAEAHVKFETAKEQIGNNLRQSFLTRTALLVLMVAMAWYAKRKLMAVIVRPVEQLVQANLAVAAGDLSQRVELWATPELRLLGESFNAMVTSLQAAEQRIRQLNEELENRVRLRTEELAQAHERLQAEMEAHARAQQAVIAREKAASTGRMAAGIAHEINNPLNGIRASLLVVERAIASDHPDYAFLERIKREIDRIAAITRRMFTLYRPAPEKVQEFSMTTLVQDVVHFSEATARTRGVRLTSTVPEEACPVRLPEAAVSEVLYNLVKNAVEASPDRGEVRIELRRKQEEVILRVADQGKGIPANLQDRVFEPFFSTKTGPERHGMGMGLAVARARVEDMRGRISFTTHPRRGTTFEVVLPFSTGPVIN